MTNGVIRRYIIIVTSYINGQTVYTDVVSAGEQLSDTITGLGETCMRAQCFLNLYNCHLSYTQIQFWNL